MTVPGDLLQIWAKKKKAEPEVCYYPLLYHMLDVAMVAQRIWDEVLRTGTKHFWSEQLGLTEARTGPIVSFWAGLHDIGKASPAFQNQWEDSRHDIITAYTLKEQLYLDKQIAVTVGGHHGIFPRSENLNSYDTKKQSGGKSDVVTRKALFEKLAQSCGVDSYRMPKPPQTQAFFMFLAGLTSVADWIASNEDFFPYDPQMPNAEQQLEHSRRQAAEALQRLGWTPWHPPETSDEFTKLFPFIKEIRPMQSEIIDLAQHVSPTLGLVIIEAPMGEGKTEAAMYLADSWAAAIGQKGCYFALPTQATSDQMFSRVLEFLKIRYPQQMVNFLLLHGHAALSAEFELVKENFKRFEPSGVYSDRSYDRVSAGVVASEWFTYRKRGLLAPFGVGTIDQALLAVLQTRHVFVRLFGLAGKTVIIDEVHAYDAYMSTLLERLLEWLAALGSSVILLSATLPKSRRHDLLKAYQRGLTQEEANHLKDAKYPRISWVTADQCGAKQIATSPQSLRTLALEWVDGNLPESGKEFELGKRLQEALCHGGCAAVICNTIDRAQRLYRALKKYFSGTADDGYPELDLLHARYLWGDRQEREKRTLLRFGKKDTKVKFGDGMERTVKRPNRAVLVSTQIIEQSLDIDFDLMVTEMAPVDLLLQRSGRLQRHDVKERPGNIKGKPPTLWICQPGEKENGRPDFSGGTEAVYERHILLRSWLELKPEKRTSVKIPEDVEELIEAVYGERECPADEPESLKQDWMKSQEKLNMARSEYEGKARTFRILPPYYEDDILEDFNRDLEEDDPSVHESLQALTRLSEQTLSVICLYGNETKPYLDPECREQVETSTHPSMNMVRQLLYRSVLISRKSLVQLVTRHEIPQAWRENALLRHHYLLCFDRDGRCNIGDYEVTLDGELGLMIEKNEA